MAFFPFMQNNSGGRYDSDRDVAPVVIIEAPDVDAANDRAETVGIYFDGCDMGVDCECCGDRWYRAWSDEAFDAPGVYNSGDLDLDTDDPRKRVVIHYANGDRWESRPAPELR